MSDQKTYTVLSELRHNGDTYERGDVIELEDEYAEPLLEGNVLKEGEWQLEPQQIVEEQKEPLRERNEPESEAQVEDESDAKEMKADGQVVDDEEDEEAEGENLVDDEAAQQL